MIVQPGDWVVDGYARAPRPHKIASTSQSGARLHFTDGMAGWNYLYRLAGKADFDAAGMHTPLEVYPGKKGTSNGL